MTDPVAGGEDKPTGHQGSRWKRLFSTAQDKGVPLRTILTIDAVVIITWVAYRLLGRLREIILWILIAAFIALVLNPAVVFLQRHRLRRAPAVGIVFLVALLAFIGLLGLFGYPLINSLSHFATKLPSMVNQLEKGHGRLAHTLQHFHLLTWVQTNAPKLQTAAQKLGKPALSLGANLGKAVLSTMLALFTIAFLSLFMLIEAPVMRAALLRAMAPERRRTVEEVGARVSRAVTSYVLGTVALSLAFGAVVFVTLALLGVPFALLIGLWVALVAMIPLVGGLIAAVPSVLIALLHSPTAAIVMLVVFVGFQLVENHFLYPIVMSRTVRMNPLLVLLSVLIGANLGGVFGSALGALAGALAAIPIGAAIQVIVKEVWLQTQPSEEPTAGAGAIGPGLAAVATRPESPDANGIDHAEDPAHDDRRPVP
ncbi:MAG TPA: AI-2E family transporter [Acidimicrobiales bacterium]|nr:AI-2E family transporter [Acidimicrobiales bacterium]